MPVPMLALPLLPLTMALEPDSLAPAVAADVVDLEAVSSSACDEHEGGTVPMPVPMLALSLLPLTIATVPDSLASAVAADVDGLEAASSSACEEHEGGAMLMTVPTLFPKRAACVIRQAAAP